MIITDSVTRVFEDLNTNNNYSSLSARNRANSAQYIDACVIRELPRTLIFRIHTPISGIRRVGRSVIRTQMRIQRVGYLCRNTVVVITGRYDGITFAVWISRRYYPLRNVWRVRGEGTFRGGGQGAEGVTGGPGRSPAGWE